MHEYKNHKDIFLWMRLRMLHKNGVTLYSRIESILRNRILSGQYEPTEKLPTFKELGLQFNVSKITIRGAVENLKREGLLEGRSGKGIFVAESITVPKQLIVTGDIQSVIADAERYAIKVFEPQTVQVAETKVARDLRAFFQLSNVDNLVCFRRMRLIEDVPIYFIENFLPTELAKFVTRNDLIKRPLLKVLKEKRAIDIGRGEMHLQAVTADIETAELLHCPGYDPLIQIQVYYWLPSGEPLEMANSYMRPDYFKYKTEIDLEGFKSL